MKKTMLFHAVWNLTNKYVMAAFAVLAAVMIGVPPVYFYHWVLAGVALVWPLVLTYVVQTSHVEAEYNRLYNLLYPTPVTPEPPTTPDDVPPVV